jgi:mono/diheme cytochrome c family protein
MKVVVLALLVVWAAVAAFADSPLFASRAEIASLNGEQIYAHICVGCHMPAGQGAAGAGTYPKLASNAKLVSWQFVALTVINGRNGMPPFGQPAGQSRITHLTDAQIADVVNYVRSHFENHFAPEVTPAQVAALPHPTAELVGPQ